MFLLKGLFFGILCRKRVGERATRRGIIKRRRREPGGESLKRGMTFIGRVAGCKTLFREILTPLLRRD